MLGLVVSSIFRFSTDLGQEKVVQKHINKVRSRTLNRTVTSSFELRQRVAEKRPKAHPSSLGAHPPSISAPFDPLNLSAATRIPSSSSREHYRRTSAVPHRRKMPRLTPTGTVRMREPRLLLLREEKDRFEAMRAIQHSTTRFKRWYALTLSILAFGILWCVGAVVFWQAEKGTQGMTYFQALYFCYVSLLTIG